MIKETLKIFYIFILRAVCTISLYPLIPLSLYANPFFGEGHDRSVAFHLGQGLSTGWLLPNPDDTFVPFVGMHIQYAAPNEFLHLPGRYSVNGMVMIGWGRSHDYRHAPYGSPALIWDWNEIAETAQIFYVMQEVALLSGRDWYFALGMGLGMQRHETDRIGTKFVVPFRLSIGYAITESVRSEVFFHHFSNGSTGYNYSYNMIGLGVGYSF